jgi:hypothetical protein
MRPTPTTGRETPCHCGARAEPAERIRPAPPGGRSALTPVVMAVSAARPRRGNGRKASVCEGGHSHG